MILVCSGLALDRFTHDSSLFRFGFRQVYMIQFVQVSSLVQVCLRQVHT